MILNLPKGSILKFDSNDLTEHNRSELQISPFNIEKKDRMSDGTLRKQFIATKRKVSVSWDMCPSDSDFTVDGKWGGEDIKSFYDSNKGEFNITISHSDSSTETFSVMFEDFSYEIKKRWDREYWSISISLEEV